MPLFDTGNQNWDHGLASLGNALFPDPAKVAEGYYYGSQARKAQIEGYKTIDELNYKKRFLQMQPDSEQPLAPATYSQPPINGMGPIINPPSNLPIAPSGTPAPQAPPLS